MKTKILAALAALSPLSLLAEGSTSTSTVGPVTVTADGWNSTFAVGATTASDSVGSGLQTMLGNILSGIVPVVGAVILAGVAIWAMPRIVGIIKSGFQSGKGR